MIPPVKDIDYSDFVKKELRRQKIMTTLSILFFTAVIGFSTTFVMVEAFKQPFNGIVVIIDHCIIALIAGYCIGKTWRKK